MTEINNEKDTIEKNVDPNPEEEAVEKNDMEKNTLAGIDLGTSHIAISVNNNCFWMPNVAGMASDIIAKKFLGENWIVGEQALLEEKALEIVYPVEGGLFQKKKNKKAVEAERHLLMELLKKADAQHTECAVIGVSPLALKKQKEDIISLLDGIIDNVTLAPSTFLAGYASGNINKVIVIDIGAGTVDITPLYGAIPSSDDHWVHCMAGNFLDGRIYELFMNAHPDIPCSHNLAKTWKEKYATLLPEDLVITVLTPDGPREVEIGGIIRKACTELAHIIIKGLKEVLELLPPEQWDLYLQNLILAGRGSNIKGLADYLTKELAILGEVRVQLIDDPRMAVARGAELLARELY